MQNYSCAVLLPLPSLGFCASVCADMFVVVLHWWPAVQLWLLQLTAQFPQELLAVEMSSIML